jgi:hypothetical protein
MAYERLSDEQRKLIPKEFRCEVNYSGYHNWEIVNPNRKDGTAYAICTKCLKKVDIDKLKEKE